MTKTTPMTTLTTRADLNDLAGLHHRLDELVDQIYGDEGIAPIFRNGFARISISARLDGVPASHDAETDDARVLCELRLPAHVSELHGEGLDAASMVLTPEWWGEQTLPVRHDGDLPTAKLSGPIAVSLKDCDVQCLGTLFDRDAEVIVRIKDESDGEGDE